MEFKDGSLRSESERLRTALAAKQDHEVFVLAEEGRAYSSHEFAEKLQLHHGKPLLFIIGGAYGMEPALKQMGHHLIALSPLTFTHEMARFLLLEQLYALFQLCRAVNIITSKHKRLIQVLVLMMNGLSVQLRVWPRREAAQKLFYEFSVDFLGIDRLACTYGDVAEWPKALLC